MEEKKDKLETVISPANKGVTDEKKSFWHINREMLPYKLHFLLFIGGSGATYPFNSAFGITVLGLTAGNIAACFTAVQVSIFLLKPVIGYLADYFNRIKAIMVGLALIQVIFFLLMIIIPSDGMPGIDEVQRAKTSENTTYCHLCFHLDTFKHHFPKLSLDEDIFDEISSCFNNNATDNMLINCPFELLQSSNYNDTIEIRQTACNLSFANKTFPESSTTLQDLRLAGESSSVILHIKTSQFVSLCLLPVEKSHFTNFSSDDLNQYCYSFELEDSTVKLHPFFQESDFTSTNCDDLSMGTASQHSDERSISSANFQTYQFWAFAVCLVITCTCGSAEFTMSDTVCYESIQGNDYGHQRVWGAISWGLMAPFAGYLNDCTESYMASWGIYASSVVLQIWNLSRMNLLKPHFSQNILKDMKTIFSSMEFLFFEAGVLLNGIFTGIIWYYLTWFIVSIGGNKLVVGLVHTVQCFFGEVPLMYFSGWFIEKLGHFNLVSLALISHGVRFFFYSYLHNAWWILPIECLHGFSFGSFYAAMTSYGKLNSKPGTEATTQSVLCTTFEALGCGLGCVIAGICFECFGGHATFFYASFVCVLATLFNILSTFIISCRKGSQNVTKAAANTERY